MKTKTNQSAGPAAPAEAASNQSVDELAAMLKSRRSKASSPAPSAASPANPQPNAPPAAASNEPTNATEEPAPLESNSEPSPAAEPLAAAAPDPTPSESTEELSPEETPADAQTLDEEEMAAAEEAKQQNAVRALQKRISKIVKQRNDERLLRQHAEQQVAELQTTKVNGQETKHPAASTPAEPYGSHPEISQLNEQLAEVESVLNWTDQNPDGFQSEDGKLNYDAARIRQVRAQAVRKQQALLARKEARVVQLEQEYNAARSQNLGRAREIYPWMQTKTSPEYQEATAILQRFPALLEDPEYPLIVGDYMRGRNARLAASAAKSPPMLSIKPKASTTPTPVITASAGTAPKIDPLQKQIQAAEAEFETTGSMEAYKKVLKLKRQVRQAA